MTQRRSISAMTGPVWRGPTLWVVVLGLLAAGGLLYSLIATGRAAERHAPLADAAMEIKLEAALAHQRFDEAISGDRHEAITRVWEHLDRSALYARAMLHGGENSEGVFVPLDDPELRGEIEQVLTKIEGFRAIAKEKWAAREQFAVGSEIDQRFNAVFDDFLGQADNV